LFLDFPLQFRFEERDALIKAVDLLKETLHERGVSDHDLELELIDRRSFSKGGSRGGRGGGRRSNLWRERKGEVNMRIRGFERKKRMREVKTANEEKDKEKGRGRGKRVLLRRREESWFQPQHPYCQPRSSEWQPLQEEAYWQQVSIGVERLRYLGVE